MASALSAPHLHDEDAAFAYVEARVWPEGPVCPHCGGVERIGKMQGQSTRQGLYKCYQCRKPFTVSMGTIFESSHVPLHIWLQAMYLIAGSKKGISSNQLARTLGLTVKSAWFLSHRIREAMRSDDLSPFGTNGGGVEADETFIGWEPGASKRNWPDKMKVLALIDRESGRSRAMVIERTDAATIMPILEENIAREAHLLTDDAGQYRHAYRLFERHDVVRHKAGEYVNAEQPHIHTNVVEGYFSIFKRGMRGVYQWCGKKHLHRYVAEFDFRYNHRIALGCNDEDRADSILRGIIGKRLTYQTTCARA